MDYFRTLTHTTNSKLAQHIYGWQANEFRKVNRLQSEAWRDFNWSPKGPQPCLSQKFLRKPMWKEFEKKGTLLGYFLP